MRRPSFCRRPAASATRSRRVAPGPTPVHQEGERPVQFYKADIDAAFRRAARSLGQAAAVVARTRGRRVPLRPAHRKFAWVIYRLGAMLMTAMHFSIPFGAASSVANWERDGAVIAAICRRVVRIPLLRYVDDLFSADRRELARAARGVSGAPAGRTPRAAGGARNGLRGPDRAQPAWRHSDQREEGRVRNAACSARAADRGPWRAPWSATMARRRARVRRR